LVTLVCLHVTDAMLISGYAAGSHYRLIGGGSNQRCLPEYPQLQNHIKTGEHSGYLCRYWSQYSQYTILTLLLHTLKITFSLVNIHM